MSAAGPDALAQLVGFGRALRAAGLPVGSDRIGSFCSAASLLDPPDPYWAGRATLVARREDVPVYDKVFREFFAGKAPQSEPPRPRPLTVPTGLADHRDAVLPPDEPQPELALASEIELLRHKSFSRCSREELELLARLMRTIQLAVPTRRSRRFERARSGSPDLRRTLRRSFRTGGEPLERGWRTRRRRRRRLVLVLDVSGSMTDYSRALVTFAHAALRGDRRFEAFCFGTRLTRVTRALATSDADEALGRAAAEVFDWDGGTRIGESLKRLLDEHGHAGLARGAVVVICSDGLEVGDPDLLSEQMGRLSRLAHRVVWLNPLKENPDYEPLARGMRSALPHVDVFASGHDLASLEELGRTLARL